MSIEVRNITKRFGTFTALDNVSQSFPSGELVALLGPSGSGKTSLLRIIAGLEAADEGQVLFQGEDATDRHVRKRGVGFVFQHYALFRHMTVFENVAFGLRVKPRAERPSRGEIKERVNKLLKMVQLDWLGDRLPSQLSGGQRQRVALARALAVEPKVLLLDEPFGALDANVRKDLRRWLRRLHDEIHVTSVFVTHDVEEALEVADRIVVMNNGRVEQTGTPEEVYDHPASPFVYSFLGSANVLRSTLSRSGVDAAVYARPHDLELLRAQAEGTLAARIEDIRAVGPVARVDLVRVDTGERLEAELPKREADDLGLLRGQYIHVRPRVVKTYQAV